MNNIQKYKEYLNRRISPNENFTDLLSFPRFIEIETINAIHPNENPSIAIQMLNFPGPGISFALKKPKGSLNLFIINILLPLRD